MLPFSRPFKKAMLTCSILLAGVVAGGTALRGEDRPGDGDVRRPVNPAASPEAVALLAFLHEISGRHTLVAQHAPPLLTTVRAATALKQTKHQPAMLGFDFGFSAPGTWDGIDFRQCIVDEAIRRHRDGFVITLMWHAVRPIEDEPVEFERSIQGQLTPEQWRDLFIPGTEVNERWQAQVDTIAFFLRQLRDARVPVLWRPYHEMNGGWFWWGKRGGADGYARLYRMLYDRLVRFHRLDNLLWVFNANEVRSGTDPYATYYPGADVVDVLATDVYQNGFAAHDYEELLALAGGKVIALGEVGRAPSVEVLRAQPRWAWFMSWGDPVGNWKDRAALQPTFDSEEALTHEDLPWVRARP